MRIESIIVCLLDRNYELDAHSEVGSGNERASLINQEKLIKFLIEAPSNSHVVLIHNHPFDEAKPSEEDANMTSYIQSVCDLVGRKYMDHIIIAKDEYYSFNSGVRTKYATARS